MNTALLKIELLCKGVRTSEDFDKGRRGGAGPSGGRCFILPDGSYVDVPLQGKFVRTSPFSLVKSEGKWLILRDDEVLVEVKLVPRPKFYDKRTSDGVLMRKVAILHGVDCLASTVYSRCVYWSLGKRCKFCAIEAQGERPLELKKPEQLSEVVEEAVKEGVAKHVTLTIGTPPGPDKGAIILANATKRIKSRVNIPVHVQLEPPDDGRFLGGLYDAGVDTVGIHVESFDEIVLSEICPMKADLRKYLKAWKEAVELFGEGQVSSFLIAGLGEDDLSILRGAEEMARIGVIPYLLPLRPLEGSALEDAVPPPPEKMIRLYEAVCDILHKYGLDIERNKAGCVRCNACSALKEAFCSLSSYETFLSLHNLQRNHL